MAYDPSKREQRVEKTRFNRTLYLTLWGGIMRQPLHYAIHRRKETMKGSKGGKRKQTDGEKPIQINIEMRR